MAAIISVAAIRQFIDNRKYITGEEWFAMQEEYINQFETFSDDMDSITALYINGDLDQEAFLSHMELFEKELDSMQTAYKKAEEENPVRTGTHTYYTKLGCDAVSECYDIFRDLIHMEMENYVNTEELGYTYIAYQQKFIDSMSDYMSAEYFITGESEGDDNG